MCDNCVQMKRENKQLRESNATMSKMQAEFANENLKLKKLLSDHGIYPYGHIADTI